MDAKRTARYKRRIKRLNKESQNSKVVFGPARKPSYNEITAAVKRNRTPNYGGKVLWDSSRKGQFIGSTERLR